jgi:serine/threonine-protein phosphatase 5
LEAIEFYTKAINDSPTAPLFGNRAFCHIKLENFGSAIADAAAALKLNPRYVKAYYRRGSAMLSLGKYKQAEACFKQVLKIKPKSKDAKLKLAACGKMVKAQRFAKALERPGAIPLWQTFDPDALVVSSSYDGPSGLPEDGVLTHEWVVDLMEAFKAQKQLHPKYVCMILVRMTKLLSSLPSLIQCELSPETDGDEEGSESRFTICGDTHGQFYDLCNIFKLNGYPSSTNPYLFNGDFVDRGSFSLENVLTLFCWKLLYPDYVHLLRGNHETVNMNKMYGFEGEVKAKTNDRCMKLFTECFRWLPLAAVVDGKVFVTHGGLFSNDGVKLNQIASIDRNREPPEAGPMCDLLWSDPAPFAGRHPSKRGCGLTFGPDVTKHFLKDNELELLVRSHEVKMEGFLVEHDGKCITVFSAPNYCDQMGNKGAMLIIRKDLDLSFKQFESSPHPDVKPMAYVQTKGMFGL